MSSWKTNGKAVLLISVFLFSLTCSNSQSSDSKVSILVFSRTEGYVHKSIGAGQEMFLELGKAHGYQVDTTKDAGVFTDDQLKQYKVVVFLNTTKDVLDENQQVAFQRFIRAGGGFIGIHAAADTEYEWPWYNRLVGAYFKSHPKQQDAGMDIVKSDHPATKHLPERWDHFDEWYNYRDINPDIEVLINLDESTYEGGENGKNHPITWCHEFDGGRAFYTGLGHTDECYQNENFQKLILGGLEYVIGKN